MPDWFIKTPLKFNLAELTTFIQTQDLEWRITDPHQTKFCNVNLPIELIQKIESSVGFKIKRDTFFLWDYQDRKDLPLHIDPPKDNLYKAIACVLPLYGRFVNIMWKEKERNSCLGVCEYGPGDIIILNNRKYYHEGFVLDDTRIGLHFYSDFEDFDPTITLEEMIERNK